MLRRKNTLTECFSKAKKYYKDGEHDKDRDYCDMGIAFVREKRSAGALAKDKIEGVRVEIECKRGCEQSYYEQDRDKWSEYHEVIRKLRLELKKGVFK